DTSLALLFSPPLLPESSPLVPYTTLFRSRSGCSHTSVAAPSSVPAAKPRRPASVNGAPPSSSTTPGCTVIGGSGSASAGGSGGRSEEHTSELQSRENLVCRLLLEKKNITC